MPNKPNIKPEGYQQLRSYWFRTFLFASGLICAAGVGVQHAYYEDHALPIPDTSEAIACTSKGVTPKVVCYESQATYQETLQSAREAYIQNETVIAEANAIALFGIMIVGIAADLSIDRVFLNRYQRLGNH